VAAVDASPASVRVAATPPTQPGGDGHATRLRWAAADAQALPFRDGAFDLAYTVNVLHHLKRGEQERALRELHRVLRPGGRLVVAEVNVRNPLFRVYMRHIFPRTRRIDRGDEEFLDARSFPLGTPLRVLGVTYATFLPDFVPRALLRPLRALERLLESTPARAWGIHYAVVLERPA
ncbi:MAG TPA: class I SAM-dependent methyltransferase, partial [Candidatus Thermoplasmatota archaeon]|nr:class I SAM-dependent methyltransferase [Candidatus Thermoplasmatota archaeon]